MTGRCEKLGCYCDICRRLFLTPQPGPSKQILGADVPSDPRERAYVAWQNDQDAYACSGQKCSAQSAMFVHKNWVKAGLLEACAALAARRSLKDLTVGPVITWTTAALAAHTSALLAIPGARLLWGGKPLTGTEAARIPAAYGAFEPTAVSVPLKAMLATPAAYATATREVFGPLQIVVEWDDGELPLVLQALERMEHHLTAGIVSNNVPFVNSVLGATVNGTQYVGLRARTTGAPQNHWFGPSGDPRGAGIGTKEAIQLVWSSHREIIEDFGPIPANWATPPPA